MRFRFPPRGRRCAVLAALTLISLSGVPALDFPAIWEAVRPLVGRVHPLLVHFPIGLLFMAGLLDLGAALLGRQVRSPAVKTCLFLGLLGAALAVGSGWVYAEVDPPGRSLEETLWYHRWVGVAAGGTAALSWLLYLVSRDGERSGPRRASRLSLFACLVLVSTGGHLGGEMVHGEAFLTKPWQQFVAYFGDGQDVSQEPATDSSVELSEPKPQENDALPEPTPLESDELSQPTSPESEAETAVEPAPVPVADQVLLVFRERCIECHGPEKQKAKLRLDIPDGGIFADDGPVSVGSPDDSLLLQLVSLPADDLDIMPAKGDPLTAEQIDLIRTWIADGALWP